MFLKVKKNKDKVKRKVKSLKRTFDHQNHCSGLDNSTAPQMMMFDLPASHAGKRLTPEELKAIGILRTHLTNWEQEIVEDVRLEDLCRTNHTMFLRDEIKTSLLPRGIEWLWNQSRSRQFIFLDEDTQVCFFKLNTRNAKGATQPHPCYKLWVFIVNYLMKGFSITFIWCEKGTWWHTSTLYNKSVSLSSIHSASFHSPTTHSHPNINLINTNHQHKSNPWCTTNTPQHAKIYNAHHPVHRANKHQRTKANLGSVSVSVNEAPNQPRRTQRDLFSGNGKLHFFSQFLSLL